MIKCEKGDIAMIGDLDLLKSELAFIIHKFKDAIEEATGDPEFARDEILKCVTGGLMSIEEMKQIIEESEGKEND